MKQLFYKKLIVNYRENTADEMVLTHSFDKDIFLSSIPFFKIKTNATVIDVGAHIGTFSLFLASAAPLGKFYAIEPSEETYNVLVQNVIKNNLQKNIVPCKVALFNVDSELKLYHDEESGNWGHSIVSELSATYEKVKTMSIESLFKNFDIDHCDLIKFNCEGAEFKIIDSMSNEILNKINTWIILYHEDLEKEGNHQNLIKRLKDNKFKVNLIRVSDGNLRGWITATKNYKQYYRYSILTKIKMSFANRFKNK
jgi:FkbM family methyltransferase